MSCRCFLWLSAGDLGGGQRMFARALGLFRELGSAREIEELERLVG
jgi:hypothetical protein